MTRVLVTGAAGFIGRHTLASLLAAGYEVHALTSRPLSDGLPELTVGDEDIGGLGRRVSWHRGDLLAAETATALVRELRPTHLLHLAWYTKPGAFWTALQNFDWVQASLRLLRAFGECEGRRAVLAGTCTEYAWASHTHCVEDLSAVEEDRALAHQRPRSGAAGPTSMRPATLYGAAKHALHVVAERWALQTGVGFAWGRVFYAYGPHEHPDRLASAVATALVRGEEVKCTDGAQERDYLYTLDLGDAFAALLHSDVTGPVNMASGAATPVADLVMAIAAAAGRPDLVRLGALPQRPGDPARLTADVRRLRDEVGWRPTVTLREGAAATVQWWKHRLAGAGGNGLAQAQPREDIIPAAVPRTTAPPWTPPPASAARRR